MYKITINVFFLLFVPEISEQKVKEQVNSFLEITIYVNQVHEFLNKSYWPDFESCDWLDRLAETLLQPEHMFPATTADLDRVCT